MFATNGPGERNPVECSSRANSIVTSGDSTPGLNYRNMRKWCSAIAATAFLATNAGAHYVQPGRIV
jgi:hypothetical protein